MITAIDALVITTICPALPRAPRESAGPILPVAAGENAREHHN